MAAANFELYKILYLFIFIIIVSIPQSFSQSNSPQNIQVFYPLSPPPPPPDPVNNPIPITPPVPRSSSNSSTRAAVGRAIGITAASTLLLSGLVFFLLLWRSRRKRQRINEISSIHNLTLPPSPSPPPPPPQQQQIDDNFVRVNGNVKGVIVDEDGLDVLYWRKLEEGDKTGSFKKREYYKSLREEGKEQLKRIVSGKGKKYESPIQQVPLLRGKSSTSQCAVWSEKQEDLFNKGPIVSSKIGSFKVVDKQDSSLQLVERSNIPLPPSAQPPPAPPVLPLPPMAVGAVPKGKMAPPPPPPAPVAPPPPPKGPGPAAPPPPPPSSGASALSLKPPPMPSKRSSSVGEVGSSKENGQVKLKPLHWDKVNPNVEHSMVWDKLDKGSFKFDGDLMEALFGSVATNRKSPQGDSSRGEKPGPPSQIFILDTRKSQNTAIVLKSLGVSRQEIIDALIDGRGLNSDTIEKLTRIAPTAEEASEILSFRGDPTRLADAESFLYHLLKAVPSAFTRFDAMLFRINYDAEVLHIKESLQSLESACSELRTKGLFLKLLEAVLKAGNRLNAGTSRGNAQAFNLTALRKLSDVKSSDGKTTLLQFVVQEVVRAEGKRCVLNKNRSLSSTGSKRSNEGQSSDNSTLTDDNKEREYMMLGLPVIGGLSGEFLNVKKSAVLDYEVFAKTISDLAAQVKETQKVVEQCGTDGKFANEMKGFLDTTELEIRVINEEQTRVMELVKKTTDYYQARSSKDKAVNPLHLFVIVRDFLGMVDQVCVEIARNVQTKKQVSHVAGSSPTSGSPRVFRFPKLPANFMSDKSSSGDSDSDDPDVRL